MSNPQKMPMDEANTSHLDDPISESAAALNAYLRGGGGASPLGHDRAAPYNGSKPAEPIIIPPERPSSHVTGSLSTYIIAALLFSMAVREGALIIRRMVFAETTTSQREASNFIGRGRVPPPAVPENKAAGKPAAEPAGRSAAVIAPSFSSRSVGDKDSQRLAATPAQSLPPKTKPWSETVEALKQLFTEHRAIQAERWKPQ
jgi:hypothetical protein